VGLTLMDVGGCNCPCAPIGCQIPAANLTSTTAFFGAQTLTYTAGQWLWYDAGVLTFLLDCLGGSLRYQVYDHSTGLPICNYPATITLASYTCSPFSLTFTAAGLCGASGGNATITYP